MPTKILTSTSFNQQGNLHYYHLPKGLLHIELYQLADGNQIIDSKVITIPDSQHRYYLTYHANSFSSDKLDIEFSPKGFLKSIKTQIKDETTAFAQKLADSVSEGVGMVAGVGFRGVERRTLFSATFDPFDESALKRINYQLEKLGYELEIEPLGYVLSEKPKSEKAAKKKSFGVYCRPIETFELVLRSGEQERRDLITLPHPELIHFIEIPNARFVQNIFEMNFDDNGYPINIHIEKPSQAMALVSLPINILKAIFEIPSKIFSFRINYDNQKLNYRKEQLRLEEALDKQEEELKNLSKEVGKLTSDNQNN